MTSGFKIKWTDNALKELKDTYLYLEENWTNRELKNLSLEIERTIKLISENPKLFPISKKKKKKIRKAAVKKLNTIYYRETKNQTVEILSFFSNRQNPNKRKL
jgi:plasmid stabilization system protein ParE